CKVIFYTLLAHDWIPRFIHLLSLLYSRKAFPCKKRILSNYYRSIYERGGGSMNGTLLTIIIISVIGYLIFAIHFNYKVYKYIWKPGTMVLIILLAMTESGLSTAFSYLVLFALLFSLFGDVFLLREEWFVHGLASFLIAHILYSIGFVVAFDLRFTFITGSLLIILMMIAILFFLILQPNVRKNGGRVLLLAVAGYITVITTM